MCPCVLLSLRLGHYLSINLWIVLLHQSKVTSKFLRWHLLWVKYCSWQKCEGSVRLIWRSGGERGERQLSPKWDQKKMIKLEAVSERDEVSGLGTLQEDILPQAINLITFQTPNSTALSTVVLSSSRHDNSASVVKDVLGCPVVVSRYAGCKCHSPKTNANLTAD